MNRNHSVYKLNLDEEMRGLVLSLQPDIYQEMLEDLTSFQAELETHPELCTKSMPEHLRDHIIDNLRAAGILTN